jgi:hypothetical protein
MPQFSLLQRSGDNRDKIREQFYQASVPPLHQLQQYSNTAIQQYLILVTFAITLQPHFSIAWKEESHGATGALETIISHQPSISPICV